MKNTMRKMLSLALVVVMLACAIPFSAFALTDLELARQEQTKATKAYNDALAYYNTVASDREALRTAKNNADTALANAKTARDLAAAKLTEATKAEADAKAASDAKYLANKSVSGYDHSQSDEYKAWYAANLALNSAQADSAAKQSALDAAQTAVTDASNKLAPYDEMFARAEAALKNAKLLKDAADEAVRVAEANQSSSAAKKASLRLIVADQNGNTITTINRELETTNAFDLATLIPAGYTFVRMKSGNTSSIVPLTEGQNNRTIIVKSTSSSTVTPPSTTAVPATVQVTVLKNDTARTQIGVYTVSISDINVTKTYDIKNLIPSGYTFISRKNGSTDTVVTLTSGLNKYTVIVAANSGTVTPPSTTAVPATVKVTVLKNDTARTQIGVYSVSISDINVTKTYDIKNLIPSGYTFVTRQNGSTVTNVTLRAGENAYTVIVSANGTNGGIWLGNNGATGSNPTEYKFPGKVYLQVYTNTAVGSCDLQIDITSPAADDNYISLAEAKTAVEKYYTAKTSRGIQYDGLYPSAGFPENYISSNNNYALWDLSQARNGDVILKVMITNATRKTTTAADTSNPKTGDMAFLTVTALVASAGALALVYANKKRFLVK